MAVFERSQSMAHPFGIRLSEPQHLFYALGAVLVVCVFAGLCVGGYHLDPGKVLSILLHRLNLPAPSSFASHEEVILLSIRLPRLVLAIAVGGALGIAGAVMQSLFRNPLAEPGLVGVSSGAALAAVVVIVGVSSEMVIAGINFTPYALPIAAFAGGLGATTLLYLLARNLPGDPVPTMLLIGIAINAVAQAGIGMSQFLSTDTQLRLVTFWMMGGLGSARWATLGLPLLLIGVAGFFLLKLAQPLNAYLLGSAEARHLGVDPKRLTRQSIFFVALAVGAAVAVSGIISFVGLVVPHLVRLVIGPDNRIVLPASALLGASFMVVMDVVARSIVSPAELPIGLVCAAVGGPFFLWLLMGRSRRETL